MENDMHSVIYLLGDSILDNGIYTETGVSTMDMVAERLKQFKRNDGSYKWLLDGNAVDGATIASTVKQTGPTESKKPRRGRMAAHPLTLRVISMGGNDLLPLVGGLAEDEDKPVNYIASLEPIANQFEKEYRQVLELSDCPTLVMTIWRPHFGDETLDAACNVLVGCFNGIIWRLAQEYGADVFDLHGQSDSDWYANPIEPNLTGSEHIAKAICEWATKEDA